MLKVHMELRYGIYERLVGWWIFELGKCSNKCHVTSAESNHARVNNKLSLLFLSLVLIVASMNG